MNTQLRPTQTINSERVMRSLYGVYCIESASLHTPLCDKDAAYPKQGAVTAYYATLEQCLNMAKIISELDCIDKMLLSNPENKALAKLYGVTSKSSATKDCARLLNHSGHMRPDGDSWVGGDLAGLYSSPKKSRLDAVSKVLASVNADQNLAKLSTKPTRSRKKDSADGDWCMSRQWDTEPFIRRVLTQAPIKRLVINANIAFNAGVSASSIDALGEFIAGLVGYFESRSVCVEINLVNYAESVCVKTPSLKPETKDSLGTDMHTNGFVSYVRLKNANQYLPLGSLINCLSANFYRRITFSQIILSGLAVGQVTGNGLGRPYRYGRDFHVDKEAGAIDIYSALSSGDVRTKLLNRAAKLLA